MAKEERMSDVKTIVLFEPLIKEAVNPSIGNFTCVLADFEYNFLIGECKKFIIKSRGGDLNISFIKGQSNVTYILLLDTQSYYEDLIHTKPDFRIYFQSPLAGCVLEIISWF